MLKRILNLFSKPLYVKRIDQIYSETYIPPHFHIDRQAHVKKEK